MSIQVGLGSLDNKLARFTVCLRATNSASYTLLYQGVKYSVWVGILCTYIHRGLTTSQKTRSTALSMPLSVFIRGHSSGFSEPTGCCLLFTVVLRCQPVLIFITSPPRASIVFSHPHSQSVSFYTLTFSSTTLKHHSDDQHVRYGTSYRQQSATFYWLTYFYSDWTEHAFLQSSTFILVDVHLYWPICAGIPSVHLIYIYI